VIAAKNGSKKEIVGETADLLYHTLVMLAESGVEVSEVYRELKARQK
jgi:phosphoribosyl-ATP pyrophosphohydrolase/phosphoribosyl-AMP cyclohydrolase